ncbi:MAG: Ig-like domain repeat protein, partial [Pseudomonadota bacterium]|nr:Ig-like domain repeat protein [Pseudomonadota bacterium]
MQETTDATGAQGLAATTTGTLRTWQYTYDAYGQLLTTTDPNGQATTNVYYASTDPDVAKRGNVATITNPLGHVTQITAYDANGRPLAISDSNGLVTALSYHPRGWLAARTVGGETTSYSYDGAGQLTLVTLPDGSTLTYSYDGAHRLSQLQDGLGNKIVYTLDAQGNRIKEEAFDPAGTLARTRQQVYDGLNRLHQSVLAAASAVAGPSTTTLTSSANPAISGASVAFIATVTGAAPSGNVNFADGGPSIPGCGAVALTGASNSRTATCNTNSLAVGTHGIVANYSGDAANVASASASLAQGINAPPSGSNVALASVGAVASASSTWDSSYPVLAVNDNERSGAGWGSGGAWADATGGIYPDWVQINFNGSKSIDRIVVYTLQNDPSNPIDPPDTLTFSAYGVTDFTLQAWNGSAWITFATVTGNNLVKRTVTFPAVTTDGIRVTITNALQSFSRIAEIAAWGVAGPSLPPTTTLLASSLNPATVGANVTFTATVSGSNPTGNANFTEGGSAIGGCSAVALIGSGSSRTAACSTSTLAVGTHSIVANYGGNANNAPSTSAPLTQLINGAASGSNVALASVGAVASASSTWDSAYPVLAVNDNERSGAGWGNGGGWADATGGIYPDWVQINFNGSKTIDRVVVYSLQDNWSSPVDPPDTLTFSAYGVTDFTLQAWNGAAWVTFATVTGNNLVKRTVTFPAVTTDRVRVNVTNA